MAGIPTFKIAISTLLQDEEEAARAIELARGLREECPQGIKLEVVFFSHGSSFDQKIQNDGFLVCPVLPELPGIGIRHDLRSNAANLIGEEALARRLLKGEIEAIREVDPDAFLHGFWPIAAVAAKLARVPCEIAYLPVPFAQEPFFTWLMKDAADFAEPLMRFSPKTRRLILSKIPMKWKLKAPALRQENILAAYREITGRQETPEMQNLFDMLKSDFTIVNDLPVFYEGNPLPKNFRIVGPLFPPGEPFEEIELKIRQLFDPENRNLKVFCTLGNSGGRENLLEAVRALACGEHPEWDAVVVCPPSVCSVQEARALAGDNPHIYITDAFMPALKVNSMAGIVLSNGASGTLQNAVACGTPVVGFAARPEEQIHLDHLAERGAAVRIPVREWKADAIREAVVTVSGSPEYFEQMKELQVLQRATDGKKNSAAAVWENLPWRQRLGSSGLS